MATFSIILDSCLVCDGRRVEPTDLIDIYLDPDKFPDAESPVRAVVLDVRSPEPPESILGKVALDVQAADEDMPEGVSELDPDDILFVRCVDCCIRNTERIEELEEKIIGTQETIHAAFPPFLPASITLTISGTPYVFNYQGDLDGFPYWETADALRRVRRDGENWIVSAPGDTYVQQSASPVYLPWFLPSSTQWTHTGPNVTISYSAFSFNISGQTHSSPPVLPSNYDPDIVDTDAVFLVDDKDNLWYWTGDNWRIPGDIIPWNPANAAPDDKLGSYYRITASGSVYGQQVWPGDVFWRNYSGAANPMVQVGAAGSFYSVGVTTNTVQTITAAKTWTATQTFADVDINGGYVDNTDVGRFVPRDGFFSEARVYAGLGLGVSASGVPTYPTPTTGSIAWYHSAATTSNLIIETIAQPTATRTQTKPDASGYYAIVASPTGKPDISEVSGIVFGQTTLVAGIATVSVPGATEDSVVVATGISSATPPAYVVDVYCSDGDVTFRSSNTSDTRMVNYMVKI